MDKPKILKKLSKEYPGKTIICLPDDNPLEIICELDPIPSHPERGVAIAVINRSKPHYHKKTTETYSVLDGELTVFVDGKNHVLKEGESLVITPQQVHFAVGNSTWIECTSVPRWTADDHFLVEK